MMRLLKGLSKQTIREGVLVTCQETNMSSFLKGKQVHLQKDRFSYHALIAEELTILRKIVGLRLNLLSSVCSAIIWVIVRNFTESRRNNHSSNKYNNKQMFLKKAKMMKSICLWHHKLAILLN
jgi:hypothetical protein